MSKRTRLVLAAVLAGAFCAVAPHGAVRMLGIDARYANGIGPLMFISAIVIFNILSKSR